MTNIVRVEFIPDQIRGQPHPISKIKTIKTPSTIYLFVYQKLKLLGSLMTNIVRVEFITEQIRGKPTLNKTKTPSILFNFLSKIKLLGSLMTNIVRVEFIPDQICGQPTL